MIFKPSKNKNVGQIIIALQRKDKILFTSVIHKVKDFEVDDLVIIQEQLNNIVFNDKSELSTILFFADNLLKKNILLNVSRLLEQYVSYNTNLEYELFKLFFENIVVDYDFINTFFSMPTLFRFCNSGNWTNNNNYKIKDVYERLYSIGYKLNKIESALTDNDYSRNAMYKEYLNDVRDFYLRKEEEELIVKDLENINKPKSKTRKL